MDLKELAAREPIEQILLDSLLAGWSEQFGTSFRQGRPGSGTEWRVHPALSVVTSKRPSSKVRKWAADIWRFSPRPGRSLAQYLLYSLVGSSTGFRLMGREIFWVTPRLPTAADILIMPGNRRVRIFDFANSKVRTVLKPGYTSDAVATEVAIRHGSEGPYVSIDSTDGRTWFEEALVDSRSLPRMAPWKDSSELARVALGKLEDWKKRQPAKEQCASVYHSLLKARIVTAANEVRAQYGAPSPLLGAWLDDLLQVANRAQRVVLSQSHGDFQSGNILVRKGTDDVFLTDWEYSQPRSNAYDYLTFRLSLRSPAGLGGRVRRFLAGPSPDVSEWRGPVASATAVATAILEDLVLQFEEAQRQPFAAMPIGLQIMMVELGEVVDALGARARR